MTISRWLRMKADEEMREIARAEGKQESWKANWIEGWKIGWAEGKAKGIAESNKAWDEWLRKMREAQRDGKPFDEPPPSSRR